MTPAAAVPHAWLDPTRGRRKLLPQVPIVALTATATRACREDVRKLLKLKPSMRCIETSFNRPNLSYAVVRKGAGIPKVSGKAKRGKGKGRGAAAAAANGRAGADAAAAAAKKKKKASGPTAIEQLLELIGDFRRGTLPGWEPSR